MTMMLPMSVVDWQCCWCIVEYSTMHAECCAQRCSLVELWCQTTAAWR